MNLTVISQPTLLDEPVSMAEARDFLHLGPDSGPDDDSATIATLIAATRELAELQSGRQQARKQFSLALDAFPNCPGRFSYSYAGQYTDPILYQFRVGPSFIELLDPLVSVESVIYKQADGTPITLTVGTDYVVDLSKSPGVICPATGKTWPGDASYPSSAVKVTFTAGHTPTTVLTSIKQGMLLLISQMFYDRIPFKAVRFESELPYSVTALLTAKKLWRF